MSQIDFIEQVKKLFADLYPKFTWEDFFLDEEKQTVQNVLENAHHSGLKPHTTLNALLKCLGRL